MADAKFLYHGEILCHFTRRVKKNKKYVNEPVVRTTYYAAGIQQTASEP